MSEDTRQWCFLESRDSETAYGPFDSREQAIEEARNIPLESCVLSRCNWADPGDCDIIGDEQDLMEALDDATDDVLRNPEDPTYSLKPGAKVQDLCDIVAKWLRENLKTDWFSCDPDEFEDVNL